MMFGFQRLQTSKPKVLLGFALVNAYEVLSSDFLRLLQTLLAWVYSLLVTLSNLP